MTNTDRRDEHQSVLDPNRVTHLGIWRDEHNELTREFFQWEVPDLPESIERSMAAGIRNDLVGMNIDNVADLLHPGHLPLETGMARCSNGEISVAIWTSWPGTTPEMIDWWFGWHIAQTERYKLWHPQAHYFAQPKYDRSDAMELTDRERYVGNTSWVDEYIGPIPSRLAISFHDPAAIGLDQQTLDAAGYGTVVHATTADSDHGNEIGQLIHAVRRTRWGSEMRSRFIFPPETPELIGPFLIDHCWTEMTHLAGFLPHLHARVTGGEHQPGTAPTT